MKMSGTDADVIDALVGIRPGSPLDAIRARRPEARAHAQATYRALFAPEAPGNVTAQERFAESGASAALKEAVDAVSKEAKTHGPYGSYPAGPLSREDTAGLSYRVGAAT